MTHAADCAVDPIEWRDSNPSPMPTREGGRSCIRPSAGGEIKLEIEDRADDGTYGLKTYIIYRSEARHLANILGCDPRDLPARLASYPIPDEQKEERTFEGMIAFVDEVLNTSKGYSASWGVRMPD